MTRHSPTDESDPGSAESQAALGHALWKAGDALGAIGAYAKALAMRPADAQSAMNLAHALSAYGDHDQALTWMKHALAVNPADPVLHMNLGVIHFRRGEIDDAASCYARAVDLRPSYAEAWLNYGNAALYSGDAPAAIERFERALEHGPHLATALSNIVLGLNYVPEATPADILRRAKEWNDRFALPRAAAGPAHADRRPDRPLRVGYVSPDLSNHPIGNFMLGVFANHDPGNFPVVVYAEHAVGDTITQRLEAGVSLWRKTLSIPDAALVSQIIEDRIDILVDLAGHSSGNRLRAFTAKPAPVQVTWIGSVGTTGLAAMDYLIADRHHAPAGSEDNFVETPLLLDQWICFVPPADAPDVGELPSTRNGYVTFGCFANPAKINPALLAAWGEILGRTPGSRLLLKYRWMNSSANRSRVLSTLAAAGVAPERVQIEGEAPHKVLLGRYGDVDIALDTFPYSGGMTTMEALWMGVPVVTCPGARFSSRHSLSLLSAIGLTTLVVEDVAGYVARAAGLAADPRALADLRRSLRGRVAQSRLRDAATFTRHLEDGLRRAWRVYCGRSP